MAIIVKTSEIAKLDESKMEAYGVLYYANKIDSQGEFASADELKKGQERLAKSGRLPFIVDLNHDKKATESYLSESYIGKKGDPLGEGQLDYHYQG